MNLTEPLIGIGGKLRSGKDTLADFLVVNHAFVKVGMSDALHAVAMRLNPIIGEGRTRHEPVRYAQAVESLGYVKAKEFYPEIRAILQRLGTDVGRNFFGENVWVDIIAQEIDNHRSAGHPVVVTGIRYPNELQMIRELSGWSVYVERDLEEVEASSHTSETSVRAEQFDIAINNNGTLLELEEKARVLASETSVIGDF